MIAYKLNKLINLKLFNKYTSKVNKFVNHETTFKVNF